MVLVDAIHTVQEAIVKSLKDSATYCTGTSNCYLAMKYDMPMMGTHPHEWFMFHGAMYGYKQANYMALEDWVSVYDGDLGKHTGLEQEVEHCMNELGL